MSLDVTDPWLAKLKEIGCRIKKVPAGANEGILCRIVGPPGIPTEEEWGEIFSLVFKSLLYQKANGANINVRPGAADSSSS